MWHDGDYDEYNNYGDDDLPSDWMSSSTDAFDEYEDYVTETGNDPYHVFDDNVSRLRETFHTIRKSMKRAWKRVYSKYQNWRYGELPDDIPF